MERTRRIPIFRKFRTPRLFRLSPCMDWTFTHVSLFRSASAVDTDNSSSLHIDNCSGQLTRTVCTRPEFLALYPEWRPVSPPILNPYIGEGLLRVPEVHKSGHETESNSMTSWTRYRLVDIFN